MTEWTSNISAGVGAGPGAPAGVTIEFDDAALVERCRKGDMKAFALLIAKYQDRVTNTVHRLCGNHADAEELSQETFVKALERLGQFRGQAGFYTWLFRIAVNLTISHRRRGKRIKFHSLDGADDLENSQAGALTASVAARREACPSSAAMSAEAANKVQRALEQLDEEFRVVAVLRDIEDMDYSQIAQVLELPVGTVKSRLHRARLILKDKLAGLVG